MRSNLVGYIILQLRDPNPPFCSTPNTTSSLLDCDLGSSTFYNVHTTISSSDATDIGLTITDPWMGSNENLNISASSQASQAEHILVSARSPSINSLSSFATSPLSSDLQQLISASGAASIVTGLDPLVNYSSLRSRVVCNNFVSKPIY